MRSISIRILVATSVLFATLAAHARIDHATASSEAEDDGLTPRPASARVAALGFDALLADYYWLRAVQIVGSTHQGVERRAPALRALTELVVGLDPWVDHPYRFAALWLIDSEENVRAANRILERGIAYHPVEWRNRFYLSFNHFFFLHDAAAAAAELEPAVRMEGSPRYLGRLLARLRSEDGDLEAAATYLVQLLRDTEDGFRRAEYEKALDEIETERRARVLDAARETYRTRHGRDIERVEDLVAGPNAVLSALPPEPHGWEWKIDERTGEIISTYVRYRYRVQYQAHWVKTPPQAPPPPAGGGDAR